MASSSLKKHDVFISFRGEDTRANFTSFLHAALCRNHIETYIDYRIEKGEEVWDELEKAIKASALFLVVFSENYASSTWCLNELVEIMKCNKNDEDNVVVIPVFYRIEPSHVRKQTGSYHSALAKQKKQGKDKIQKWKNALFEVANLSGFDSSTYRNTPQNMKTMKKARKSTVEAGSMFYSPTYSPRQTDTRLSEYTNSPQRAKKRRTRHGEQPNSPRRVMTDSPVNMTCHALEEWRETFSMLMVF